jgi:hypothetical protein
MTDLVRDEKYSAKRRIVSTSTAINANTIAPIAVALEKIREQRHIHTPRRWTDPPEPHIDDLSVLRIEGEADNAKISDWWYGGTSYIRCTAGVFEEMMARELDKPEVKLPPIIEKRYD